MKYNPSGIGEITLDTILLDLNGTLSVEGIIVEGVADRITKLKELGFKICLLSGDRRGTASIQAAQLGIELVLTKNSDEKAQAAKNFNFETTVAIGNARIDIGMFDNAKVRIATLQKEGIHTGILSHVDIVVPSINDALDLLLNVDSFDSTMRI